MIGYNDPAVGGQRRRQLSEFLRNQSLQRAQGAARLKGIAGGRSPFGGDRFSTKRSGDFMSKFMTRAGDRFSSGGTDKYGGQAPQAPFFGPGLGAAPVDQPFFGGSGPAEPVNQPFYGGGGEQAPIFIGGKGEPVNIPWFSGGDEVPVDQPFFGPGAGMPAPAVAMPFFGGARVPNFRLRKPLLGDMSYGEF